MRTVQHPCVPASTRRVGDGAGDPPCFSVILSVTAEKPPRPRSAAVPFPHARHRLHFNSAISATPLPPMRQAADRLSALSASALPPLGGVLSAARSSRKKSGGRGGCGGQ